MSEFLSSRNNEKIKTVRKLADKKYRNEFGLFVIEGHKLVSEYLNYGNSPRWLFVTEEAQEKYAEIISRSDCNEVYRVSDELYTYMSLEHAPQGILAVCALPTDRGKIANGNMIMLQSVRDAGNLGTVIRTAVALGIKNVVISDDCADLYNPKTLRGAMGGVFGANICISDNLVQTVNALKAEGRRVYAAMPAGNAVEVCSLAFGDNDCIVVGNEGNGISDELVAACNGCVTIPMVQGVESLNASVAASILMWELVRGSAK